MLPDDVFADDLVEERSGRCRRMSGDDVGPVADNGRRTPERWRLRRERLLAEWAAFEAQDAYPDNICGTSVIEEILDRARKAGTIRGRTQWTLPDGRIAVSLARGHHRALLRWRRKARPRCVLGP